MIVVPKGATKTSKRIGRGAGSGTGCRAGKGDKGQKARSGGKVRPGFEGGQMPLYRRLPRRGFSNYPFKQKPDTLSLSQLDRVFAASETVNLASLKEKGLIKNKVSFVKILGSGEITKSVALSNEIHVSASAAEKIIAAGGSVEKAAVIEAPQDKQGKFTKKVYRKQQALKALEKKDVIEQEPAQAGTVEKVAEEKEGDNS